MPVRSLRRIPVYTWIPPTEGVIYKITVNDEDITDEILSGEIANSATEKIGSFSFTLSNASETYTNKWSGGEIVKFYADYGSTASTLRFRGTIEKVSYNSNKVTLTGRSYPQLLEITVTKSYSGMTADTILKDLIDTYLTGFTYSNVNSSTNYLVINWYQKPFWDCVKDICYASNFDCYVDSNQDFHFFEVNSIKNSTEIAVHDYNILEVGDFGRDLSAIKNKIIIYGAKVEDLPLIYTKKDDDSIAQYGEKELVINDQNITTIQQAQERVDYELSFNKDPPIVGDVTCIGLPTLQPGENIRISAPYDNLPPAYYKIISFTHEFGDFFKTTLNIEKEGSSIPRIISNRINAEQKLADMPNPNEMNYSWNFDFNTDSGTHSSTEIVDGYLHATSSPGTWISETNTTQDNVSAVEIRVTGDNLSGVSYYASVDDGVTWYNLTLNTQKNVTPGNFLKIKVVLTDTTTKIDSLALLYKT